MADETPHEFIAKLRAENAAERERGRQRLIELDVPPAEIDSLMQYAERMHAEQIACTERRLGLAPPVAVH